MPQVRVTQRDVPLIQEIFDALAKALENLPEKLMRNEKFGILAMMAIFNLACRIGLKTGVSKDEFMRSVGQIWDDKAEVMAQEQKDKSWN
jgi:hypothetical protein